MKLKKLLYWLLPLSFAAVTFAAVSCSQDDPRAGLPEAPVNGKPKDDKDDFDSYHGGHVHNYNPSYELVSSSRVLADIEFINNLSGDSLIIKSTHKNIQELYDELTSHKENTISVFEHLTFSDIDFKSTVSVTSVKLINNKINIEFTFKDKTSDRYPVEKVANNFEFVHVDEVPNGINENPNFINDLVKK
ncbi:hypothetical protein [Mycoplasmopsis agassizii]|uniref:Lipoprotein n=1 Tax=Mycoplasmopsis agassizii TaxID=33922 RepID=A0ABX4H4X1_9BACT|nr:hypothetical protein [Mycoplasmopsis agassizii]PAF54932.1 hypothetical protein CJF60_04310 [Mycoplasmopsis agassizii]SMC17100.1 hypothetical protein SAMN02745179_00390 [Mycoplasmopsis agassizii]